MSIAGIIRSALWTEIQDALVHDFPELKVPTTAPKHLEAVVKSNADYISELVSNQKTKVSKGSFESSYDTNPPPMKGVDLVMNEGWTGHIVTKIDDNRERVYASSEESTHTLRGNALTTWTRNIHDASLYSSYGAMLTVKANPGAESKTASRTITIVNPEDFHGV